MSLVNSLVWVFLPLLLLVYFMSRYFADRAIHSIRLSFERQNQFLADASHELKTPLATINANAALLLDTAAPEQRKWLKFIRDETIRLERLTSNLLYLSRGPVNTKNVRVRADYSAIVNGVLMPLEAVLYEKHIDCTSDIQPDLFVLAPEDELKRLVGIFIENAIKYTENQITVTLKKQNKTAILTVTNNGSPIPTDDLDKIWDRFYRSDKSRANKGGFGLGLAMAKSILDELGGSAKVASDEGATTFTVTLPLY